MKITKKTNKNSFTKGYVKKLFELDETSNGIRLNTSLNTNPNKLVIKYNETIFFKENLGDNLEKQRETINNNIMTSTASSFISTSGGQFTNNKNLFQNINDKNLQRNTNSHSLQNNLKFLFIPCINCNNLVFVEDIENHSNICTRVKEEVIIAESSPFSYHTIEFKLKKLQEHVILLKNQNILENSKFHELNKDGHYMSVLLQYISDCLNFTKIEHKSVQEIKKLLANLDTLIASFKGSIPTLILIERTRVLVYDKFVILREDLKKILQSKKVNYERKSGTLNTLKRQHLQKEMEEKKKIAEKLENEKTLMKIKINNLKNTYTPKLVNRRKSTSPIRNVMPSTKLDDTNENRIENDQEYEDILEANEDRLDANKIYNKKNVVEEINSDLDNDSVKSGDISDNTSMASSTNSSRDLNSIMSSNQNDDNENLVNLETLNPSRNSNATVTNIPEFKKAYQQFVKTMLKVKFEKMHNSHKGQEIHERILFKECLKQNVPVKKWAEFIESELKNPHKYNQIAIKGKSSFKHVRGSYTSRMEVISEEI